MREIFLPMFISALLIIIIFLGIENFEAYFHKLLISQKHDTNNYWPISLLILSSDIMLPVPSSIVMYMNGLVLGTLYGFMLSFISALISATLGYLFGRCTNFGFKKQLRATSLIHKYGNVAIIITRGIPIISESISYTAGYNKIPFKNYFLMNILGYIPVCFIYAFFWTVRTK